MALNQSAWAQTRQLEETNNALKHDLLKIVGESTVRKQVKIIKIKTKLNFRFLSNFAEYKLSLTNNGNNIRKLQALEAELLQYKALVAANEQPLMSCSKNVKRKRKNPEAIDSKSLPLPEKHPKKIVTDVEQEATITEI